MHVMIHRIGLLLLICFESTLLKAQMEDIIWQNCLGAAGKVDLTNTVEKTNNGYLFGIGIFNDGPGISKYHGGIDAWIVNTDEYGNVIWERCYGGSEHDSPHKIMRIDNNTYYLFNNTNSNDGDVHHFQGKNFWVVKIKENGEIIWEKCFGGSVNGEVLVDGIVMPDKGALMMGRIYSSGGDITHFYGDKDVWLCRIDSVGNMIWQKTIGNLGYDKGMTVKLTSHNTILFVGGHEVTGGMIDCPDLGYYTDMDVWIVEMDMNGNLIDQWCYGGKSADQGYDVVEVADGFIITAITYSNDRDVNGYHGIAGESYFEDIWTFKIDFFGNLIWQKCLGGYVSEFPNYITITADSGIVIIGTTTSHDGDVTGNHSEWDREDIWVVKLSSDGQLLWEHCFGGLGNDKFYEINSVVKKDDYNYVIGATSSHQSGDVTCNLHPIDSDAWIFEIKDCLYYLPLPPGMPSRPDTLCTLAEPFSFYSIDTVQWAIGYEWRIEPDSAGNILSDSTASQITWNPIFEGPVSIQARSYNDCGYSAWSNPFVVQVYSCMAIEETGGQGEEGKRGGLEVWPNPAREILNFKFSMLNSDKDYSICIYDIFGREVQGPFAPSPSEERGWQIDVSPLPPGIYFISVFDDGKRIAGGKVVVAR